MAAALANLVKVTGSATTSVTSGSVTTAATGSTFFISISESSSHTFNTPPTDSKSNTYTQLGTTQSSGGDALSIWKKENGAGGASHTVTIAWATAADPAVFFGEVSGVLAASIDTGSRVQGSDASSPYTVTSGTLAQADELVVCFVSTDSFTNPAVFAESSGFTIAGKEESNSFWVQAVGTKSVLATTALTPSWTNTGAGNANLHIVGFKSSAASGITGAGQIASAEAIGAATIGAGVAATGIATAGATGAPIVGGQISTAGGIATAEAIGTPTIGAGIVAIGIASGQAVGGPVLGAAVGTAGGIVSAEALGAPGVGGGITGGGIGTGEGTGAPTVSAGIGGAGAIPSGESFGFPIVAGTGVFVAGIPSGEAFGQPSIAARIGAAGIGSGEAVGAPLVGEAPVQIGGLKGGFDVDTGPTRRRGAQDERKPAQIVYRKPILQRVLEERYPKVKPKKERAQRRAKNIELEAAALVLEKPITGESRFAELGRQWMRQGPVLPSALAQINPMDLFAAQVAFRIRQQQMEDQALRMLAARRAQDEEDALIALLLA